MPLKCTKQLCFRKKGKQETGTNPFTKTAQISVFGW